MNYNFIGADSFTDSCKKSVEFNKNTEYVMHVHVEIYINSSLFFYYKTKDNQVSLNNGNNIVHIHIDEENIIDIGFIASNSLVKILKLIIIDKVHNLDTKTMTQYINTYFNEDVGFGQYKNVAVNLLKDTVAILDEFKIDYCLIAGTLLGYVRHDGFIPWDDDMDLLVSSNFIDELPNIIKKYENIQFLPMPITKWVIKSCYKNNSTSSKLWPPNCKWTWPFIDLFVYSYDKEDKEYINFFNKQWSADKFFPLQKVLFEGIQVNIPKNPEYFLQINYGLDYMTILKANNWCHKYERGVRGSAKMHLKLLKYYSNIYHIKWIKWIE